MSVIQKYNVPVPRYTSYPPANFFRAFSEEEYIEAVCRSNGGAHTGVSFYLHMPFCRHLCHYCACNSYPMRNDKSVQRYVDALHREIDLLMPHIDSQRLVSQIHYGGGSPTAMEPQVLQALNRHLLSGRNTISHPEIAVECHPGYLTLHDWQQLAEAGFTRFSIGIQDFNADVLHTVNRRPALVPLQQVFGVLRGVGARINLDFLYGLPGQTPDSFVQTIRQAIELEPDRLVTFSYAHVPWLKPGQRILERAGLPPANVKERMFDMAAQELEEAGYVRVGMDHFVRPDDELYTAQRSGQLHRNFQGYCTRRTTGQVYAFGATGISQMDTAYAQNTKDIDQYIDRVESGHLAVAKGYSLSEDEQVTRQVIECLMCNNRTQLTPEQLERYGERLADIELDGLITVNGLDLRMTDDGLPFVRNVAAAIDPLMQHTTMSFSKPI